MPGLLRGIARTAVVAGTATAVSNRVSRRQAQRWQSQGSDPYSQPEPTDQEPPPQPQPDLVQQLRDFADLKDQGILTEEEFAAQKARILGN